MSEDRESGTGVSNPAAPGNIPGLSTNFHPLPISGFAGGVNTRVNRTAIKNNQLAWCDGWIPIDPDSLRTLPGVGAAQFVTPGPDILWFTFTNVSRILGSTSTTYVQYYGIVGLNDGSVWAYNVNTLATQNIMPVFSILVAKGIIGTSQWGSKYLIIVAPQTNGYWLWDGVLLYTAGTISPEVLITDGGKLYTSTPTVFIGRFDLTGGVIARAIVENGSVISVVIDSPGNGFAIDDLIFVKFNGGGGGDTAYGTIGLNDGVIDSVTLTAGGSGFTSVPTITVTDPTGNGAVIEVSGATGGILTGLKIVNGGQLYTAPVITISGGGGSGATATADFSNGVVVSATPIDVGNGYFGKPTVNIVSRTGSGAVATATVISGQVTSITITAGGRGYNGNSYYTLTDGEGPASATAALMPFGISGTCVEVYKSRVWISNGKVTASGISPPSPSGRTIFSAAGSPTNFGDDGGAFISNDSFLRIGYMALKQSNGFLYLFGDSSINYISGVTTQTTTASGITTTQTVFSVVNANPQVGGPWPSAVQPFGRDLVCANFEGIFSSLGGAPNKVSEPFDGIYQTQTLFNTAFSDYPAATAYLFGRLCYMILLPIVDPFDGTQENKLLIWDGKRCFTSQQDKSLTWIATFESWSSIAAYGTDSRTIFPLFQTPAANFSRRWQSKLYADPAYWITKTANTVTGVTKTFTAGTNNIVLTVDNEVTLGTGNASLSLAPWGVFGFTNVSGSTIAFINNATAAIGFSTPNIALFGPVPVGQAGRFIGVTMTATNCDMEVNSLTVSERLETFNL